VKVNIPAGSGPRFQLKLDREAGTLASGNFSATRCNIGVLFMSVNGGASPYDSPTIPEKCQRLDWPKRVIEAAPAGAAFFWVRGGAAGTAAVGRYAVGADAELELPDDKYGAPYMRAWRSCSVGTLSS